MGRIQMSDNSRLFFLKKKVLFPHCTLDVTLKKSEISSSLKTGSTLLALPVKNFFDFLFLKSRIATLAEVVSIEDQEKSTKMRLKGISRVKIQKAKKFHKVEYGEITDTSAILTENIKDLKLKAQQLIFLINVNESDRLIELINYLIDSSQITDFIANYFILDFKSRLSIYKETDPEERSRMLMDKIDFLIKRIDNSRNSNGKENIQ